MTAKATWTWSGEGNPCRQWKARPLIPLHRVVAHTFVQEVSEVSYKIYQDVNCKVAMM